MGTWIRRSLLVATVCLFGANLAAHGAAKSGGVLSGVVLNKKGAPVPSARVFWSASDGAAPHTLHTDASGRFRVAFLRPGLYEVRGEANGMWSDWEHNVLVRAKVEGTVTLRLIRETPPQAALALHGEIHEFLIPVQDSGPHDPAVDPQGHVWVTLSATNQLGELDAVSGVWKFFDVPTPKARPHGLVSDAAGNVWFTENSAGKIGRFDARTNAIAEFAVPGVKDPHTPAIGPDGTLWFTAANGDSITHLDPKSGETKTFPLPTEGASPSTILLGPDGAMWFCESATNKLGRLDPDTGAITEFAIPDEQARPRRIVIVGSAIYFADTSGHLGRFSMEKKTFQLWPSPSGAMAQPYGITADQTGKIWYYEAGANQMVRFDPANEKFDVFPMLSQKANVMAMTRDAQGRIWMVLGGANKLAAIE